VRGSCRLSGPGRRVALGLVMLAGASVLLVACAGGEADILLEQQQLDLGQVRNGELRTMEVPVTNQGSGDLVIQAVTTSCGCTSAQVSPATLKPGESGSLLVSFDSGAHGPEELGPVLRQVFIASNDPDEPEVEFRFSADILPPAP